MAQAQQQGTDWGSWIMVILILGVIGYYLNSIGWFTPKIQTINYIVQGTLPGQTTLVAACGNGQCQPNLGENCYTCNPDCRCFSGELCYYDAYHASYYCAVGGQPTNPTNPTNPTQPTTPTTTLPIQGPLTSLQCRIVSAAQGYKDSAIGYTSYDACFQYLSADVTKTNPLDRMCPYSYAGYKWLTPNCCAWSCQTLDSGMCSTLAQMSAGSGARAQISNVDESSCSSVASSSCSSNGQTPTNVKWFDPNCCTWNCAGQTTCESVCVAPAYYGGYASPQSTSCPATYTYASGCCCLDVCKDQCQYVVRCQPGNTLLYYKHGAYAYSSSDCYDNKRSCTNGPVGGDVLYFQYSFNPSTGCCCYACNEDYPNGDPCGSGQN